MTRDIDCIMFISISAMPGSGGHRGGMKYLLKGREGRKKKRRKEGGREREREKERKEKGIATFFFLSRVLLEKLLLLRLDSLSKLTEFIFRSSKLVNVNYKKEKPFPSSVKFLGKKTPNKPELLFLLLL